MKRVTLQQLADKINANLPEYKATVEEMRHTLEQRTPGKRYVNRRWTRQGKGIRVVRKDEPWKTVYELNLACWYRRVSDGVRWLEETARENGVQL